MNIKAILKKHDIQLYNLVLDTFYGEREHGFKICRDKKTNETYASETCKGSYCHLEIEDCGEDENIALIHTHQVEGGYEPSKKDIQVSYEWGDKFFCIASPFHDGFKYICYKPLSKNKCKKILEYIPKPKW